MSEEDDRDEPEPEPESERDEPDELEPEITAAPEEVEPSPSVPPGPAHFASRRNLAIGGALVGLVAILAIDVTFIMGNAGKGAVAPSASGSGANAPIDFEDPPAQKTVPASADLEREEDPEPEPAPTKPKATESKRSLPGTVAEAATRSCSTSSVDGLSRQIIAQSRCIESQGIRPFAPALQPRAGS